MAIADPLVCHNDAAPYNMVFRDGGLAALIEFDTASPGPRVWDFAYLAYRLVPLGENGGDSAPDAIERHSRLDDLIRAYGLPFEHLDVYQTLVTRLDVLADFTDRRAGPRRGTRLPKLYPCFLTKTRFRIH